MKWLIVVVVLLVAGVVGVGFYQGWLNVSTGGADHHPSVTVGVDENKIQADKKKLENLGEKAKEDASGPTGKVKDQEPRP
jgi:beta-lactam-binding protein with PASTA domain